MSASGSTPACCGLRLWCTPDGWALLPVGERPAVALGGPYPPSYRDTRRTCAGSGSGSGSGSGGDGPGDGDPVDTACCDGVPRTLYLTLSTDDTVTFTYDGSRYWTGSQSLAGCTVYFRFDKEDCSMEYSRDGVTWVVASCFAGEAGCFTCTPAFASTNYTFSSMALGGGCSFGIITGVLSA